MAWIKKNVKEWSFNESAVTAVKDKTIKGRHHSSIGIQYMCNMLNYNKSKSFGELDAV